jgi:protein-L-isoaspartate(D-aspartate) O-methyltransferase
MKKIFTNITIIIFLLFYNLTLSASSKENFQKQRGKMVDTILEHFLIYGNNNFEISKSVISVLKKVPRHMFVPKKEIKLAYKDRPVPIGFGQTISQPFIVALMTELLNVKEDNSVLEIGTGSGYQAAVLAEMGTKVYSVEIIPELIERTSKVLDQLYPKINLLIGDGYYGWEENAPYDAIIVTAAVSHIPEPLIKQLRPGGKMVIPVGNPYTSQELVLIEKKINGDLLLHQILSVRFVPLTGGH